MSDDADLRDWFDRIFCPRRLLGKSHDTVRLYHQLIDRLTEFLCRPATLADLNDDTACAFLAKRLAEKLSPYTVARERSSLMSLANFAARKRYIAEFLDVPQIKCPELRPEAYGMEQLRALLASCDAARGFVGKCPARLWWNAIHYFWLWTGERTKATLLFEWSMLDLDTGWCCLPGTIRKGGIKPASYHLPPVVLDRIKQLCGLTERFVFAVPWKGLHTSGAFYYRYSTILKRAGLPTNRKWKPQKLRRTFASYLEAMGGDATDALQHSSRRVTKASYLDPTIAVRQSASQVVGAAYDITPASQS